MTILAMRVSWSAIAKTMTNPVAGCRAVVLVLLLAASASPALAQDMERGRRLAGAWCAGCHVVEPNQGTSDLAPSFEIVANHPDRDVDDLRGWLVSPHPPMPDLNLAKDEIDDLISYIGSLRHQ